MLIIIIAAIILALIIIIARASKKPGSFVDNAIRRAGKRGEQAAARIIQSVLTDEDHLFNNVQVEYDGKPAELDNVIVNKYGVFIIEVKNYKGKLYGDEDDYEWSKVKTTGAGNRYEKTVKNPIKQVKRQVHILARYLEHYGVDVWVVGRAYMVNGNSPVKSEYMLTSTKDIARTLHTFDKNRLDAKTVKRICELLE